MQDINEKLTFDISNNQNDNIMTYSNNTLTVFEVGNTYEMRFIGDSDLRPHFKCIKRTAKTVTFQSTTTSETLNRRIKEYDNSEYIVSGSYSMAPSIRASRIVK